MSDQLTPSGGERSRAIQVEQRSYQRMLPGSGLTLNCSRIGVTGGLRTYAEQIMASLSGQGNVLDAVLPEAVLAPENIRKIPTPSYLASSSGVSLLRPIAWLAYGQFRFPVPLNQNILCTTHHVLPRHRHQIVTVHDLRPYFFPDNLVQRYYFHSMLPRMLKRCEGILTVSETSREVLIDIYGLKNADIRIVPNAIRLPRAERTAPRNTPTVALEEPYLLMVGATWPHKNAEEVFRMHRHWAHKFRIKVMAGEGEHRMRLLALARSYQIDARVDFLPPVTQAHLHDLYLDCAALIYPSLMEGFGLPPLEAMALGRPVIVSDIPVFREIYGPYPFYVELGDEASWEHAFHRLLSTPLADPVAAAEHSQSYNIGRMSHALNSALRYFWGESWTR